MPASRMMARAFFDYPITRYLYPDAAERARRLPYTFERHLRYGLTYHETYVTSPGLEGVAIWRRVERPTASFWRDIVSGAFLAGMRTGGEARRKMRPLSQQAKEKHRELAPFPHWYLMFIAVDPGSQGKGYASLLIKAMFDRIDKEGLPCYLETRKEANVALYLHLGFRVLDEAETPGTGMKLWPMLREAHGPPAGPYQPQ